MRSSHLSRSILRYACNATALFVYGWPPRHMRAHRANCTIALASCCCFENSRFNFQNKTV